MRRFSIFVCGLAMAVVAPGLAQAVTVAPPGTLATSVGAFAGPSGTALLTWTAAGRRVEVSELSPGSGFGPVRTVLEAPVLGYSPPFGALAAGRAVLLTTRGPARSADEVVAIQRPAGAQAFGAPASLASGEYANLHGAASGGRGDIAALISTEPRRAVLVTAPPDGDFAVPQPVGASGGFVDAPAVAVGPRGQVLVVYHDGVSGAYVQQGTVGAPLGTPQLLARVSDERPAFGAAFDAAGNATVAFSRALPPNRITIAVARAAAGERFGRVVTLDRGPNAQFPQVAAAGSTTAVAWSTLTASNGVRVAIARGAGRFAPAQAPATVAVRLRGAAGRVPSQPAFPRLAVGERGDVLLAFAYGPFSAVHATIRRAGRRSFSAPRVLSGLAPGGGLAVALLTDRRPLVAHTDGDAVMATTRLGAVTPDLSPPRLTLTPLHADQLRRQGEVTATVRCSEACVVQARGRLTTGRGGRGQVISRPYHRPQVLARGRALTVRFALTPQGRAALATTGRAQVRMIVTATNVTGAARTVRRALELGLGQRP